MATTLVPIHRSGAHQRSLQMHDINDAYAEIRRHANLETGKMPHRLMQFSDYPTDPIVKFVIINGDAVEVVDVKGFNRIRI